MTPNPKTELSHQESLRQHWRKYREAHREEIRERNKVNGKNQRRPALDPVKQRARNAVRKAVYRGLIQKPENCQDCGSATPAKSLHGHHEDYLKPLDVSWLCGICHGKAHRYPTSI